jgi:hypothetical protein
MPLRLRNLFLNSAHNGLATLQQVPTEEDIGAAMAAGEQAATASMNQSIARIDGASVHGGYDLTSAPVTTVVSLAGSPARPLRGVIADDSATNAAVSGATPVALGRPPAAATNARSTTQEAHLGAPRGGFAAHRRATPQEPDDGHSGRHVRVDSDANALANTFTPSAALAASTALATSSTLDVVPSAPLPVRHEQPAAEVPRDQLVMSPLLPGAIKSPVRGAERQPQPDLNIALRRAGEAEAARPSARMAAIMSASAPMMSAVAEVPAASPASRLTPSATTLAAPNLQGGGRSRQTGAAPRSTVGTRAPGPASSTPQPVAVRQPLVAPPADELDETGSRGSNDSVQRR